MVGAQSLIIVKQLAVAALRYDLLFVQSFERSPFKPPPATTLQPLIRKHSFGDSSRAFRTTGETFVWSFYNCELFLVGWIKFEIKWFEYHKWHFRLVLHHYCDKVAACGWCCSSKKVPEALKLNHSVLFRSSWSAIILQ